MECPNCQFVVSPGSAAVEGGCPNCGYKDRPFRSQPSGVNSDMQIRNMPDPGGEDTGGNPLSEGMLGGYQNRTVRDESFASVKRSNEYNMFGERCPNCKSPDLQPFGRDMRTIWCPNCGWEGEPFGKELEAAPSQFQHPDPWMDNEPGSLTLPQNWAAHKGHAPVTKCPNCGHGIEGARVCPNCKHPFEHNASSDEDPEFEVTQLIPPDPDSIRPDKERMDDGIYASIWDTVAPVAGGAVGMLLGGPVGAGIGAGLAGGATQALEGGNVGQDIGTGIGDAAMGALGGYGLKAGAGALEDAAANGVTKGGVGSLMKGAFSKGGGLFSNYLKFKGAEGLLNQGQQGGGGQQQMMQAPAVQAPSFYSKTAAPYSTPTSQDHIPANDTDDPQETDFKERNDGDNESKGLLGDQGVNDGGGTDLGPDDFFSPESQALSSFAELLPKVLSFALGEDSAAGDPDMEALHQKLDSEMPGYMDSPNIDHGEKIIMMVMGNGGNGEEELSPNNEPHDPLSHQGALEPGLENTCPVCGGTLDPSTQHCPQCGFGNMRYQPDSTNPDYTSPQQMMEPPVQAKVAGQGPNDDQQKAMVAELLQQEGRGEEIPNMILNPHEYAKELTAITGQEEPPPEIGTSEPPQAPTPEENSQSVPASPQGIGAGQMMAAIKKYAGSVDSVAEPCPKCGAHSTGYTDPGTGECGCKVCGHHWKTKPLIQNKEAALPDPQQVYLDALHKEAENRVNEGHWDPEDLNYYYEQEPQSHVFYPGEEYMDYESPEEQRDIYQQVGGNDLAEKIRHWENVLRNEEENRDVRRQELGLDDRTADSDPSYTWRDDHGRPLQPGASYEMYSQAYDIPDRITVEKVKPDTINYIMTGEYGLSHEATLTHQNALSENIVFVPVADGEEGEPSGEGDMEENPDTTPVPGPGQITDLSTPHEFTSHTESTDEALAFFDDLDNTHTAGAKMTPYEQRQFVDEDGTARNQDRLNLDNTHYIDDPLDDLFLWL